MIGIGAAQKHVGLLACAASAVEVDTRLQTQQIDQIRRMARLDVGARDDRDIGQARIDRLGHAARGDLDRRLQGRFLRLRARRRQRGQNGKG